MKTNDMLNFESNAIAEYINDYYIDDDNIVIPSEYIFLESEIVYFSAGDCKVKEMLIKKEASFSF